MLTVGEILRNAREKKNLTLEAVEKQIKVRVKFLKAVEENQWDNFSSKIYINGIIKNYARFLGLDVKKVLAFFRRDYEKKEEIKFKTRPANTYFISETKKYLIYGLTLIFIVCIIYFAYQLKLYFSPPSLAILSPKTEIFTVEDKIKIVGKTEKDAMITIFDQRIYQDKNGIFEYDFPLQVGKNELIIEIVGANGRKTTVKKLFIKKRP